MSEISVLGRRQLLQSSLALAGLPPLCCTSPELPGECIHFEPNKLLIDLSRAPQLHQAGAAAVVVDSQRKLNIIVARVERQRFAAIDRTCTHGGAMCTYNHPRRTIQCTSLNHAEYDLAGALLHGRTHGNLRAYDVSFDGKQIQIQLEAPRS